MPRTFDPLRHPRDKNGRFTKSRTVKALAKDVKAAKAVAAAFAPKQLGRSERGAYLQKLAAGKPAADFDKIGDANTALRAGKDDPAADELDKSMIALPDDLLLSRRVPTSVFGGVDPASLQGMKVRDAGFAPAMLGTVPAGDGQVRMHIAAPAGTRAAVNPETGEIVLDRDTEMVVSRVMANDAGGHDMFLTVLPKVNSNDKPKPSKAMPAKAVKTIKPAPSNAAPAKKAEPVKKTEPEAIGKPKPGEGFEAQLEASATGEKALEAAPLSLVRQNTHARLGNRNGLTAGQRDALLDYQGIDYTLINGRLRGIDEGLPDIPDDAETIAQIKAIDAAMTRSSLTRDVTVYRGIRDAHAVFGERVNGNLTGMEWREAAFVSTSTVEEFATNFSGTRRDPLVMRMLAPKGVHAIQLSGMTDEAGHEDEAEILLDRGRRMRVVADRGIVGGVRHLDVEVLP